MKPEEIVRALRCISTPEITHLCTRCKYRKSNGCDADEVNKDAICLIEQMIDENTELREEVNARGNAFRAIERRLEKLRAERDALIEQKALEGGDRHEPET